MTTTFLQFRSYSVSRIRRPEIYRPEVLILCPSAPYEWRCANKSRTPTRCVIDKADSEVLST